MKIDNETMELLVRVCIALCLFCIVGILFFGLIALFSGCGGTKEDITTGLVCVLGTDEQCAVVEQVEAAIVRCGETPHYTEFYFHDTEKWSKKIGENRCGGRYHNNQAHIDQWDTERCWNLPKYVYHEQKHKETNEEPPVVAATTHFMKECWN